MVDDAVTSIKYNELTPSAVTLYDLIPLIYKESYCDNLPYKDYYHHKLQWFKNADLVFAISEYSKSEAINCLNLSEDIVFNISGAADARFSPLSLLGEEIINLRKPFVIYVGGTDYRKNMKGLIEPYAILPN